MSPPSFYYLRQPYNNTRVKRTYLLYNLNKNNRLHGCVVRVADF